MVYTRRMLARDILGLCGVLVCAILAGSLFAFPDDDDPQTSAAYSLPLVESVVTDLYEEFREECDKGKWEKAFRKLEDIRTMETRGLAAVGDGFFLPFERRLWSDLVAFEPSARRAFRLFFGARADRRWESLQSIPPGQEEEVRLLREMWDQDFITRRGDDAADRLGDVELQRGHFVAAARCWQAILDHHPDTDLPRARVRVKLGTALARAGRREALESIIIDLEERHAGETVRIGGQDRNPAEFLRGLAPSPDPKPQEVRTGPLARLPLPESLPLWQFRLPSVENRNRRQRFGIGNVTFDSHVSTSHNADQVFIHHGDCCYALDRRSGKIQWRTANLKTVRRKLESGYGYDARRFAVHADGERVFAVGSATSSRRSRRWNTMQGYQLSCFEAKSGRTVWRSPDIGALSSLGFLGPPVSTGERLFAAAHPSEARNLLLVEIDPETGALLQSIPLGTPASPGGNIYGVAYLPVPRLRYVEGYVYLHTDGGALIAVDVEEGKLEWAYTFDIPVATNPNRLLVLGTETASGLPGSFVIDDGVAYVKSRGVNRVDAIELAGPDLLWSRRFSRSDTLVGIDTESLYFAGTELSALGRDKKLRWSRDLPLGLGWSRIEMSEEFLFVFTTRGIYRISKASGNCDVTQDIFRGADLDSRGGSIWRDGDLWITVSNRAVTAYRAAPSPDPDPEAAPEPEKR